MYNGRKWHRAPIAKKASFEVDGAIVEAEDITSNGLFVWNGWLQLNRGDVVTVSIEPEGKPRINFLAVVKHAVKEEGFGLKIIGSMTGESHLNLFLTFANECKRRQLQT